jgi:CBS domain-containing protein
MKVSDKMTRNVQLARSDDTVRQAAQTMAQIDAGVLPVADDERLIGMVADRDIAARAVTKGKGPDTRLSEVMAREVAYCFEDEDLEQAARTMGEQQVHRLPVMRRNQRLVGILALGDIAMGEGARLTGEALPGISHPGGTQSQTGGERS